MEINEVKIGDTVAFTHNKKKVMGKVIYRHDDSDNKKAERASLMGHVNVEIHGDKSYPVTVHVSKLKPAIKEETQMEENINETVLDLIDHIDSGDNLAAEATLNNILQQRAQEVLDALKVEVASSMFNTQECADCVEEEKKMKKKMEDDEEEDEEEEMDEEVTNEALKGGQHKIDANKNGKIDAHDFKLLRSKKKGMKEQNMFTGYKKMRPSAETPETQKRRDALVKQKQAENEARHKELKKKGLKISHSGSEGK